MSYDSRRRYCLTRENSLRKEARDILRRIDILEFNAQLRGLSMEPTYSLWDRHYRLLNQADRWSERYLALVGLR